jgi:hypothetical protein
MIAYADDVTINLSSPKDIPIVQETLRCYEDASGAKLNIQKSNAMALGSWNTSHTIMGIPYHTELRILGIKMTTKTQPSAINIWRTAISKINAQAPDTYSRTLSLDQRVLYVHNCLLAKAWYTAPILPPPSDCIRKLNTAMSWYPWQGDTFRVPLSTLYRRKEHGGLTLIHAEAKYRALLLYRLQTLSQNASTTTAKWLKKWYLLQPSKNPPNRGRIHATLDYLRILETDSAYIVPQGKTETVQIYRRLI